jgi:hypothetical protein
MKIFLFTVTLQDGEHEHTKHALIKAKDMDSAWKLGEQQLHDVGEADNGKHWNYGDGLTATKADGMQEVSGQEAKTIRSLGLAYYLN